MKLDPHPPGVERFRHKPQQSVERDIGRHAYHEAGHAVLRTITSASKMITY